MLKPKKGIESPVSGLAVLPRRLLQLVGKTKYSLKRVVSPAGLVVFPRLILVKNDHVTNPANEIRAEIICAVSTRDRNLFNGQSTLLLLSFRMQGGRNREIDGAWIPKRLHKRLRTQQEH